MATPISVDQLSPKKTNKILVRRVRPDRSQQVRQTVQWLFVALNAWIGLQFYLWVRYYERGGVGFMFLGRPALKAGCPLPAS